MDKVNWIHCFPRGHNNPGSIFRSNIFLPSRVLHCSRVASRSNERRPWYSQMEPELPIMMVMPVLDELTLEEGD